MQRRLPEGWRETWSAVAVMVLLVIGWRMARPERLERADPGAAAHARATDVNAAARADARPADIVRALMEAGGDPNVTMPDGQTPLTRAARAGDTDLLDVLLRAGAAVDAPDRDGNTALMLAAAHGRGRAIRRLLVAGADVRARNHEGQTALDLALCTAMPR